MGLRLGLSVSESADLLRLGLMETHFRMALGELGRCVLTAGGKLAYGGHLRPEGYTAFLLHELERYGRKDRPLMVCLSWSEHRKVTLTELEAHRKNLALLGEIVCLDEAGAPVDPSKGREEAAPGPADPEAERRSLSALRCYMTSNTNGRLLIGGKREGFSGDLPGVLEEAILTVESKQPIYLAGGFGGVTADIARVVGLLDADLPPNVSITMPDPRLTEGLAKLAKALEATRNASLSNGLSDVENRQLAACYRPSEIAALVSLGLGRRFAAKKP